MRVKVLFLVSCQSSSLVCVAMGAVRGLLRLIFCIEVFGGGPKGSRGNLILAYGFAKERDGATVTGKCLTEPTLTFTVRGWVPTGSWAETPTEEEMVPGPETIIKTGFCRWIL